MSEPAQQNEPAQPSERATPPPWVVSLYFAEGFPYSIVRQFSTVFFKDHGARTSSVGWTSLYALAWVLKFLWAPLVDAFSTKRRWLLVMQGALAVVVVAFAAMSASPWALLGGSALFLVLALLSATQDIAIDGFYLEALDRPAQARFAGYQAASYRLAMIAGGGGVIWFSGVAGWPAAFLLCGAVLGTLFVFHRARVPRIETARRPGRELARFLARAPVLITVAAVFGIVGAGWWLLPQVPWPAPMRKVSLDAWAGLALLLAAVVLIAVRRRLAARLQKSDSIYARAFFDWVDQPRIGLVLVFLVTYRLGEAFLPAMSYPFLKDIGITRAQYGVIYGVFAVASSMLGSMTGGHLVHRFGLRRAILPLALAQNLPNLLYMALAFLYRAKLGQPDLPAASPFVVAPFLMFETFGAGLGTSAFLVFIMRTTKAEFKAAHMAIATGIMNLGSLTAGVSSGYLATWLGFPAFFGLTFLLTIPGMLCIPFLPHLDLGKPSRP